MAAQLILAGAGAGLGAYGSIMQGKAQAESSRAQANSLRASAQEIRARAKQNIKARQYQGQEQRGEIGQNIASSGFTLDTAESLISASLEREVLESLSIQREADYTAAVREAEARSYDKAARYQKQAGYANAASSILGGAQKFV